MFQVSVIEIYNETIRDLLSQNPASSRLEVKLQQDGTLHVPGESALIHS